MVRLSRILCQLAALVLGAVWFRLACLLVVAAIIVMAAVIALAVSLLYGG